MCAPDACRCLPPPQTLKGTKWSATKWIHVGAFNKSQRKGCVDDNDRCEEWASTGECEKNPAYMNDACKLSCKQCQPIILRKSARNLGRRGDAGKT